MTYITILKRLVFLTLFLLPSMLQAATSAGESAHIRGTGIAQARAQDGAVRKIGAGAAIYSGDSISTGKDTSLDIRFADGSHFDVGPQAEFVVDKFSYQQGTESDAFYSRIVKGAFRFVSGLMNELIDHLYA